MKKLLFLILFISFEQKGLAYDILQWDEKESLALIHHVDDFLDQEKGKSQGGEKRATRSVANFSQEEERITFKQEKKLLKMLSQFPN